jgi:hypothetical protein
MPAAKAHSSTFRSRFRASAFGRRSDVPIKRIKEALAEIKKATRKDKVLGAEGAVIFLEKVPGPLFGAQTRLGPHSRGRRPHRVSLLPASWPTLNSSPQ